MIVFLLEIFLIYEFSTSYRFDRNSNGGGLMLFVRENIPSNLVETETKAIEGWLLNCSYNSHKNNVGNHLKALGDFLDSHTP